MKFLDWPPVWLAAFMALTWGLVRLAPGLTISLPFQGQIGGGLIVLGILISVLAVLKMMQAKTTVVPRRDPNALVTGGIFQLSRNPIYLSDWIMLLGWIILWGAVLALPLLWVFPKVIRKRFIDGEEAKMRAHFGQTFDDWTKKTRRWI